MTRLPDVTLPADKCVWCGSRSVGEDERCQKCEMWVPPILDGIRPSRVTKSRVAILGELWEEFHESDALTPAWSEYFDFAEFGLTFAAEVLNGGRKLSDLDSFEKNEIGYAWTVLAMMLALPPGNYESLAHALSATRVAFDA